MSYSTFESRLHPAYVLGWIPEPTFYLGIPALIFLYMSTAQDTGFNTVLYLMLGISTLVAGLVLGYNYKDSVLMSAKEKGSSQKKRKTFDLSHTKALYGDFLSLHSAINDNVVMHNDGGVSLAFEWGGVDNRNYSVNEHQKEHDRRRAYLHTLVSHTGLTVEHHFLRTQDASVIDAYTEHHNKVSKKHKIPKIIQDIKSQLAAQYRPYARSNKVVTVLSISKPPLMSFQGLLQYMGFMTGKVKNDAESYAQTLMKIFSQVKSDYPDANLFSCEEYTNFFQSVAGESPGIDLRFLLNEQLLSEKPVTSDDVLKKGNQYYKVVTLQVYPDMELNWVYLFSEGACNVHAAQFIQPLDTHKVLDKSAVADEEEIKGQQGGARGSYKLKAKLKDSRDFKSYVTATRNSVHRNFYVVTFFGDNKDSVDGSASNFERHVRDNQGKARIDIDLQHSMWLYRLPGQGRFSSFSRKEDHADTLADMMPFTTFKTGSEIKESLRFTSSGSPVTFAPSKLEVPHELVVAQMGGGKDTQFGLTVAETFQDIRYDFIELGNSYQGVIEAIGGNYCRAREQVINPLAPYSDFNNSIKNGEDQTGNLEREFINVQSAILMSIFKGMGADSYTDSEEIVVNKAVRLLYEQQIPGKAAPILPDLLTALEDIKIEKQRQIDARDFLGTKLDDFFEKETGSAFLEQDQFTISPIANAIDFDKFNGELFEYFLTFTCTRLITNAMTSAQRNQIVLNEYGVLIERAPEIMRWVTLTVDRMGRKDATGLSRITQEMSDVTALGTGAINAIQNKTLLSRGDGHIEIGQQLKIPQSIVTKWQNFQSPEVMDKKGYRNGIVCQQGDWYNLHLQFPQLLLDLMNTKAQDKGLREIVYSRESDPFKRIQLFNELKIQRKLKELEE